MIGFQAQQSRLLIWCANWEMGCAALGIQGHFAVLSATERGIEDEEARPPLP